MIFIISFINDFFINNFFINKFIKIIKIKKIDF
jgi:hypothetical protein